MLRRIITFLLIPLWLLNIASGDRLFVRLKPVWYAGATDGVIILGSVFWSLIDTTIPVCLLIYYLKK